MISIETMKFRTADMIGEEFPLVFWRGNGRIVASDDQSISLLVRGVRVDLTWDRLTVTWSRFLAEPHHDRGRTGRRRRRGRHRQPLRAHRRPTGSARLEAEGLITLAESEGVPVHQYADMSVPTSWAPWRRKIHGD